jgi:hypothetical protein
MISVSTEEFLAFHIPSVLLLQPLPSEELPNTGIIRFPLRGFQRNKFVEVLIDDRRFAGTLFRRVGGTVTVLSEMSALWKPGCDKGTYRLISC